MLNVSSASRTPGHSPHESMFRALKWLLLRVFAAVWELGCAAARARVARCRRSLRQRAQRPGGRWPVLSAARRSACDMRHVHRMCDVARACDREIIALSTRRFRRGPTHTLVYIVYMCTVSCVRRTVNGIGSLHHKYTTLATDFCTCLHVCTDPSQSARPP